MEKRVFLFEHEGRGVLGFDTGLDARAFAQAKFAQFITEPGFIVRPDSVEVWKASGVAETFAGNAGESSTMVVWGPEAEGERLSLLIDDDTRKDEALAAICRWISAFHTLEANPSCQEDIPLLPCAAIIGPDFVFFAPPSLARLCAMAGSESYVNPAYNRQGVAAQTVAAKAVAFTAAAMLYRVFAGKPPFYAADESDSGLSTLHQDMRDGNFLPVRLAAPGLNADLAVLIQNALAPTDNSIPSPGDFLAILQKDSQTVSVQQLTKPVSPTDLFIIEKEKSQYLKVKTASVKTKRFIARNTALLLGGLAALVAAVLIVASFSKSRSLLPTTEGMDPAQVIETYYNAIGDLDHQLMEACVTGGAGKGDINMVVNFYVISRVRQAYEYTAPPAIISAREWQERGSGPVDSGVLGVTGLQITVNSGQTAENRMQPHYRADYTLWVPAQAGDDPDAEPSEYQGPRSYQRTDFITLIQKKGNWRISEITRE